MGMMNRCVPSQGDIFYIKAGVDVVILKGGAHSVGIYVHVEISTQMQIVKLVPRLNNLGTRPQERTSLGVVGLTDRAQCMRMSSIDMGLDYDSTIIWSC